MESDARLVDRKDDELDAYSDAEAGDNYDELPSNRGPMRAMR